MVKKSPQLGENNPLSPKTTLVKKGNELQSILFEDREIKISSPEAQKIFDDLSVDISNSGESDGVKIALSMDALDELVDSGFQPVFTVPREYIDDVINHGLKPRAARYYKTVVILTGTIGLKPYNELGENRYIAVLRDKEDVRRYHLQPRYTSKNGDKKMEFSGVISTMKEIPVERLIIIDSKDMSIVYPKNTEVEYVESSNFLKDRVELETSHTALAVENTLKTLSFNRQSID